jgi:hypothetical protein
MRDERTNPGVPPRPQRTHKRCPSCGASKPVAEFYTTPTGGPSGYCKDCQRTVSRRARKRRNAAVRALIALHPGAWRDALCASHDHDAQVSGGGRDA